MNATISLREYLKKGKCFVVPNYQRGYVWGKKKTGGAKDSVTYILDSLLKGYDKGSDVFVQGITVSETVSELNGEKIIILIDGQQRTTFFFLLLKSLNYGGNFKLQYDIRKKSDTFLKKQNILDDIAEVKEEEFQDIYFFKKTLRIIRDSLNSYFKDVEDEEKTKEQFCNYVLDNVKFLYINIPKDKATKVFTMMNGNKAEMKAEELIKAELLRLASLNDEEDLKVEDKETLAVEWDNNMLRSRYAREWDKWLQWWNRKDVKKLYKTEDNCVMGLLVETYQQSTSSPELSFENFRDKFLKNQKPIEAKQAFDGLRRLQKRFEDAFSNPIPYNRIGAIIRIPYHKKAFIKWYFLGEKPSGDKLEEYYKLAFLGLSHYEITKLLSEKSENQLSEEFERQYNSRIDELESDNLYDKNTEAAFQLLLRLNIDEDNLQEDGKGRKFDFSIWDRRDSKGRSLEHIYPKSKVYHEEVLGGETILKDGNNNNVSDNVKYDESYIDRDSCKLKDNEEYKASEHSIGNLVLLYKDDNSMFNNSSFEEKKGLFFKNNNDDKKAKAIFKSRHLLHTIYKFSTSKWDGEEIAKNKYKTLKDFEDYYKTLRNKYGKE